MRRIDAERDAASFFGEGFAQTYMLPSFLSTENKTEDPLNGLYVMESQTSGTCDGSGRPLNYVEVGRTARIQAVNDDQSESGKTLWVLICTDAASACAQWDQDFFQNQNADGTWDMNIQNPPGQLAGTAEACTIVQTVRVIQKSGTNVVFDERSTEPANGTITLASEDGDCGAGSNLGTLIRKYKAQLTKCTIKTSTVLSLKP